MRVRWILLPALLTCAPAALAESLPTPGRWRVDRERLSVSVDPWGPDCGAAPTGHDWKVSPDEFVLTIAGAELAFKGERRSIASTSCEGKARGLLANSHERREGVRVTECKAPDVNGQPEEQVRHAWQLIDRDHVLYLSEGTRQLVPLQRPGQTELPVGKARGEKLVWYSDGKRWKQGTYRDALSAQRCVIHYRQESKLERLPDATAGCTTAGPANRLSLQPATADLVAGDRVCFKLIAQDPDGCPSTAPAVTWALDPAQFGVVDGQGCVSAAAAVSDEVAVALTARSATLRASALLRVAPRQLAAKTELTVLAKRSVSARVREVVGEINISEVAIRPTSLPVPVAATPSLIHFGAPQSRGQWIALLAAIAVALAAALVIVYALRRRATLQLRNRLRARPVKHLPARGKGVVCPKCRFEFEGGTFCPFDREPLVPLEREARHTLFIPITGGMVCPTCGTRYPTKARFCGKDRSPLIPDLAAR